MSKARLRGLDDDALQTLAFGAVGDGDQRLLHVTEAGDDGLAIIFQQFDLAALRLFEQALEPEAVEHGLRQIGGDVIENRLRREQVLQRRAGDAVLAGERDARKECRACRFHAGVGGGELRLGRTDVRPLQQQLGGQSR